MIPVFEPLITREDIEAVTDAVTKGQISGTYGNYITDFEDEFANYCGVKHGIAVTSGTAALQLAIAALHLEPEDEVLVSSSTNIATALAAFHNNLITVPIDSESETWNLDPYLIEEQITPRTRVIIPVHLYGHPADMVIINQIAKKHNLIVIEDAAEAHGSRIGNCRTGSFGEMACFSFYANKTITSGEGGMIVTNNETYAKELRLLRNLAFTKPRFYHEKAGFNFRMTGMQAALGLSQLRRIDSILEKKRLIADTYNKLLNGIEYLQIPIEKPGYYNTYWMYAVRLKETLISRNELCEKLREQGIDTRTFFYPIDQQPFLIKSGRLRVNECKVASDIYENGFYLPCSLNITSSDISTIVGKLVRLLNA